jgi:hypothetical protein
MKGPLAQQRENSDVKEPDWRPVRGHLVVWVFASLPNILTPVSETTRAVSVFSEAPFRPRANILGPDTILAEEPGDILESNSIHRVKKLRYWNRGVIILNMAPTGRRCDALFHATKSGIFDKSNFQRYGIGNCERGVVATAY